MTCWSDALPGATLLDLGDLEDRTEIVTRYLKSLLALAIFRRSSGAKVLAEAKPV